MTDGTWSVGGCSLFLVSADSLEPIKTWPLFDKPRFGLSCDDLVRDRLAVLVTHGLLSRIVFQVELQVHGHAHDGGVHLHAQAVGHVRSGHNGAAGANESVAGVLVLWGQLEGNVEDAQAQVGTSDQRLRVAGCGQREFVLEFILWTRVLLNLRGTKTMVKTTVSPLRTSQGT